MCKRQLQDGGSHSSGQRGRHPSAAAAYMGDAVVPVAYTHLRAHETGLELVCRFLLEKKNLYTFMTLRDRTRNRMSSSARQIKK